MNFKFSKKNEEFLKIITKTAQTEDVRVFFVGGIVRDCYLKKEIKDIDLILEGNAIEFSKKLPSDILIKSIHKDFGTVKLLFDDIDIDLASTRIENYPFSGSLPQVEKIGVKINDDVKRRDFTVNSLYCKISLENDELKYELIDLVNGISDINEKSLKVLHKNSYHDDPTRIFRGVNFKYRFGFDFSKTDLELIKQYLKSMNLDNASIDRIKDVFSKTLKSEFQDKIFREIVEKKYYKILFKNEIKVNFDEIDDVILKFNLNKNEKAEFFYKIFENLNVEIPSFLNKAEEYKYYLKLNNQQRAYLFYKTKNENIMIFPSIKVFLTGKKLLELNYQKGKKIGEILDKLLIKKIENHNIFKTLEDETDWVLNNFPKE